MGSEKYKNKKGLHITLRLKITIMFGVIIIIMLIPLLLLLFYSNNFIKRYDNVISNVSKIDYIKTTTDTQPQRILNYCLINKNVEESGESDMIVHMMQYIAEIKNEIGSDKAYSKNMEQAEIVEKLLNNYLQNYREALGLCGSNFSLSADSKFYAMNEISGYISDNCSALLNLEMKRTKDVQREIAKNYNGMRVNIILVVVLVVIVAVGLIILLQRGVAGPIHVLSGKLTTIADKDLTETEVTIHSNDEVGALARAFNTMSSNLRNVLEKVSATSSQIKNSFDEITRNIENNAEGSEEISKTVFFMLEKIEKQNAEVREAMKNISDIGGLSEEIFNNAQNIFISTQNSIDSANEGTGKLEDYTKQLSVVNTVMQGITEMVNNLGSSAQQMNDIVNTISEISDETNLLSLNASIEAARAGEAGRGFAVVADQIQSLADNSKNSAEKIGSIIAEVQKHAQAMEVQMQQGLVQLDKGNAIAEDARKSFGQIERSINEVGERIQEIESNVGHLSKVVSSTSQNMETIEISMHETSDVTNRISDTVSTETANLQELASTMELIAERTKELDDTLAQFNL